MAECEVCKKDTVCESVDYGDKCIFHCDKSDEAKWGNPESEDVKRFWRAIREQIRTELFLYDVHFHENPEEAYKFNDHVFRNYEFPCFEWHSNGFYDRETKRRTFEKEFNFWFDDLNKSFEPSFKLDVNFNEAKFYYNARFDNVVFLDHVWFGSAEFFKNASFGHVVFKDIADICYCTFYANADFVISEIVGGLNFRKSEFDGNCKIKIESKNVESELVLASTIFKKNLYLECNKSIENIVFDGTIFDDKTFIFLQDIKCANLLFEDIQSRAASIKLTDIEVSKKFEIKNSMLDKMEFNGLFIESSNEIILTNTSFIGSHLTNVKWGEINEERFQIDRQMARQLKSINDAQGETVIANDFYALEMRLRSKELKWDTGKNEEKLVQNIHGLISNHSNDWLLPSIWFFVFGFLFTAFAKDIVPTMIVLVVSIGISASIYFADKLATKYYTTLALIALAVSYLLFLGSDSSWEFFAALVNPLNFKDSKDLLGDTNLVLIYACRIIEVFIGYQIITAIRKNTRRK